MASKRFKGKPCAYCSDGIAETQGDHVIPRALLPERLRKNPIKVPCCKRCGDLKSRAEHYAVSVLPFAGRHASAADTLGMVEARLAKNRSLAHELREGLSEHVTEQGETLKAVRLEADKLADFVGYVVRGLANHHWRDRIGNPSEFHVELVNPEGDQVLVSQLLEKNGDRVSGDLGEGHLLYQATRSVGEPSFSVWRLTLLGGSEFAGEGPALASAYWAITGDPRVVSSFRETLRMGEE